MTKIVIDADMVAFKAAALAQETSVDVVHKATGKIRNFPTRTDFYGNWAKKEGGFLGEFNKERIEKGKDPIPWTDFEYQDVVEAQPVAHAYQLAKQMMETIIATCKVNKKGFHGYIGRGDSFRLERSTILKYKGNRENLLRPVHLDRVKQYLIDRWRCKEAIGLESDDYVTMDQFEAYKTWKKSKLDKDILIAVSNDKDLCCSEGWMINTDKMTEPKLVEGVGYLYEDEKEIRGFGRAFKYFQIMYGDTSDNYKANCASDIKWGVQSAYNLIKDCKTDQEYWTKIVEGYKTLYPNPVNIKGWRGDDLTVDWLYVLKEVAEMQHMLRFEGDKLDVDKILKGYNLYGS